MTPAIFFYLFSSVLVLSAALTIFSRNPVHSVLWLILAFFNAAGLMLMLGAEFLAMVLIIVYVGAVAVLFLFVVMMLDIDQAELRAGFARHWPLATLVGVILLVQVLLVLGSWDRVVQAVVLTTRPNEPNIEAFGELLFTRYLLVFEVAGLILVVAMVGAIVLTTRTRRDARRQRVSEQVRRRPEDAVRIVAVQVGAGADPDSIRTDLDAPRTDAQLRASRSNLKL